MTLSYKLDLKSGALTPLNSTSLVRAIAMRRNERARLCIFLTQHGVPVGLPAGYTVAGAVKETPDAANAVAFSEWSGTSPVVADIYAGGDVLDTLLASDGDASNDVLDVDLFCDFIVLDASGHTVCASQRITFTVRNGVTNGDETGPEGAELSARLIESLPAVTGLVGGTSAHLDSRATVNLPAGWRVAVNDGGTLRFYVLKAGTLTTSTPSRVRGADYHGTTNAKYWLQEIGPATDLTPALDAAAAAQTDADAAGELASDAFALASDAETTAQSAQTTAEEAAEAAADAQTTADSAQAAADAAQATADGKADLVGGFVPTAQIPAIAVTEFLGSVANEAAMLALSGQKGDWCIRLDMGATFIITGASPSVLGDWTALAYPAAPVASVAGHTGVVTLAKADVGLANVDNTSDANKPVSTATQTALDGKVDKVGGKGLSTEDYSSAEKAKLATLAAVPSGTWVLLGSATASSSAQVNVDNVVSSDYDLYIITLSRMVPSSGGALGELILRSSSPANIGGTYKRGRNYVGAHGGYSGVDVNVTGTNGFPFETQSNDPATFLDGEVRINLRVNSASKAVLMQWMDQSSFDGGFYFSNGGGYNSNTTAVAGFAFAYTSGTIVSGMLSVYGLKK